MMGRVLLDLQARACMKKGNPTLDVHSIWVCLSWPSMPSGLDKPEVV